MIQESLKKEILQKKYQEDRYKFSLIGPHKDDYKFLLNGHEAKISASQGEKKVYNIFFKNFQRLK